MSGKVKPISVSVDSDTDELLRSSAIKGGFSGKSELVRELIRKYLDVLLLDADQEVPIVVSVDSDTDELLQSSVTKGGFSGKSELVRELIRKYLDLLLLDKDQEVPVVLRIPTQLRNNSNELRQWLDVKKEAIVRALSK